MIMALRYHLCTISASSATLTALVLVPMLPGGIDAVWRDRHQFERSKARRGATLLSNAKIGPYLGSFPQKNDGFSCITFDHRRFREKFL